MKTVSVTLDGKEMTSECPLGTTLQEFFRAHLQVAPEVVSLDSGSLLSPKLTLVHRCAGERFSTSIPAEVRREHPSLTVEDLLAAVSSAS